MKKIAILLSVLIVVLSAFVVTGCGSTTTSVAYEISMELTDDMKVLGQEKVKFKNQTESVLTELKFNIHANAYREGAKYPPENPVLTSQAFPNGASYGKMEIKNASVNGKDGEFLICGEDKNVLSVKLDNELYPDESVSVEIEYEITLANVISRTGYNGTTINLGNCYPILCVYDNGFYECVYYAYGDPFFSECADYKVTLTMPEKYILATSGEVVKRQTSGGKTTSEMKISSARSFAMVVSEQFNVLTAEVNGTMISYYYYNDEKAEDSLEYAKKSIKYFSDTFGKYPFRTYSVVQTPFMQGGMEYTSLVMISDRIDKASIGEVIVHETAHQWWQAVVGNNEIEHGFLDESLAEYSVVMFYENHPEYSLTRKTLMGIAEQTYKTYCSVYQKLFGNVNTVMLRSLNEFSSSYEYVNIAYIKGCIMFDCLRQTIGDNDFLTGLKKYYEDYKFKVATPDDLAGTFEKTGADTNGFFKSFYEGKVIL